jgi:hypothetical protein
MTIFAKISSQSKKNPQKSTFRKIPNITAPRMTFALTLHSKFFFGRALFEMGESAQSNFPQISKISAGTLDEIRPNRKKFAHKFWGET